MRRCENHRTVGPLIVCALFLFPTLSVSSCAANEGQQDDSQRSPEPGSATAQNAGMQGGDAASSSGDAPYSVQCGQVDEDGEKFCYVDRDTYVGWRTYHGFCHVCHAQDAVGSTFAPNLLERMRAIDKELFVERVHNGFTGQTGVMPPWKDNPNVSKRYNELYAYLMARADGALPPGRPKRAPGSD